MWKPAAAAYQVALDACGLDDPTQAALVAVHPWDLHGAKRAGLRTIWINRRGATYPSYFAAPDLTVRSFEQLAHELGDTVGPVVARRCRRDALHIVKRYAHTVLRYFHLVEQ